jgi:hypothetical protein
MEWEKKHLKMGERDTMFGSLDARNWQNFCRRNEYVITAKKAVRFDSKRDDWCRWDNFRDMYGGVYGQLHHKGGMEMPQNKKGLLLCYREACSRIVTYQDAGFTDVTPHPRQGNPNSTVTTQKQFAAAALEEGPSALVTAPAPDHGTMINDETEDRNAASAAILALDPAVRTGRPKYDIEQGTTLPPALTRATAAPAWDEDDTPLGPTASALYDLPRPMDATFHDVHLRSLGEEIEESSDEESVFELIDLSNL